MESNEKSNKKIEEIINKLENNAILDLNKIKYNIEQLYKTNKEYKDIIDNNSLIKKISSNIDNFYNQFNNKNECNYYYNKYNSIIKYFIKFKRNINYINKRLFYKYSNEEDSKITKIKKNNSGDIYILINSIFIFKKYINDNNHIYLRKYFNLLIMLNYFDILSLITCKFIFHFYINIFNDLILINSNYLDYIKDLIEAVTQFPYKINEDNNNNFFNIIINILKEYFSNNLDMKMRINKSDIWLKLLGTKMISNIEKQDKKEINSNIYLLTDFLVSIYRYNIDINLLFDNIYKESATDLNYYLNSIYFLSLLFKEEEKRKKDYCNFNLKNGFYIPKNNPLILEKIKFKENEFSLIFSFRIMNNEKDKNKEEEIIIFNLSNNINGNVILRFVINKDKSIKIIHGNKTWNLNEIKINENKDYLVCLTQSYSSYKSTKLFFFINKLNNDNKDIKNLSNKNVIINKKSIKTKQDFIQYETFDIQSPYPYFDSEMILELGKTNFNGIIGDFFIINKKLNATDIFNLFNLNGYYSCLVENINDKYDLINKFDNFYINNKEYLNFFKKLNFNCILKILSYKLNNQFVKNNRELIIENFGILKHKFNNQIIKVVDLIYSIDFFFNKNGIEFLVFQLHNIFNNTVNNNINDNLYIFNIYLYETLKLFYEIITRIDDVNTIKKKNDSLKFSYFILSLIIILYNYKNKGINFQLDSKIYDLLLKYVEFYNIHNYVNHRNIILSILLDDSFFNQNNILKDGKILIHLMAIIKNNLNYDKDIINDDILYKILNLDFILTSKEYHHKLYMKLILSLLLIKNNKMIFETIIKNIIHIKNEQKLYHYMKCIYINLINLKDSLQNEPKFISFLNKYSKKEAISFHCKYCFDLIFIIHQIKEELIIDEDKLNKKKKKKNININNSMKDTHFLIKYKICLIKCKFINCFKINNDIKLNFIKNNTKFSSGDNNKNIINKKINEKDNKDMFIHIELNLLEHIRSSKIISNFDSIINDLYLIYNICYENQRNKININDIESNDNIHNEEKKLINNIFDIMIFFWEELIKFYKNPKNVCEEHILFLNNLLSLRGIETFFRIYLMHDYKSAINILHSIIKLSINQIKHPFYYNYIEIDENIDKYDKANNDKIKNQLTEIIILEIDKLDNIEEIITHNREILLLIIYEIVKNKIKLSNEIEKHFILYLRSLAEKKFYHNKTLYKSKGESYILLEITLNILFDIYKNNNFSENYNKLIYEFIINNNKSIFSVIDEEFIKGNLNNNKKEIDLNILYTIYFLIYFIEMKNNLKLSEVNLKYFNEDKSKNENNPIIFINKIISIIFSNSKEIFKLIPNKKSYKYNNPKVYNITLESYNILYNYYSLNNKKFFSFEDIEKYYQDNKFTNTKIKGKESKNRKKGFEVDNSNNDNNEKLTSNFIVNNFNDNLSDNFNIEIIDDYIPKVNESINNNNNNTSFHKSISSFRRKTYLKNDFINDFNEKPGKEKGNKIIEKNDVERNKENINKEVKDNNENIKIKDVENGINNNKMKNKKEFNSEDSSEEEVNEINNNKKNEKNNNIDINQDKDIEQINISKITSLNTINLHYSKTNSFKLKNTINSSFSKTNSTIEDESSNNNTIHLDINLKNKDFNLKSSIDEIDIPMIYYKQLINYNQLYYTKILTNPKVNFIWKIFTYSFRDIIFNNKNFIKISKCFKIFTKKYILEMSSEEENKYHLNYPTKIKNFICHDYYRPFLKPDMKFFNRKLIKVSHNYIPQKTLEKINLENRFSHLNFVKFLPINESEKDLKKFFCENISYKGSIFGKMYLLDPIIVFVNKPFSSIKKGKDSIRFFLYSKEDTQKYKNINKIILFYFNEISEIILRRFCFKYIGYEIFLKDGRSYLFNFFTEEKINEFNTYISSKHKDILINDPINYFEKKEYKTKFKKGEINNFQYLLLVNKFSTRTYNNNSEYLVFPIIYMNLEKNIKRDLSKAVCLNKEESEVETIKYIMNYNVMKCYFNNHYSTSAYILYYLVRLIPYTYLQIDFQSGKFDVAERIFSNYNNYCTALITSSENRELIPEFYHNYEVCINLNYNNIGKMQHSKKLINNFNSNKYKNSIKFIVNHRKSLDNINIVPWINNIFGYNQMNESKEVMNIFPLYSYEKFNDFDKEIFKMKDKLKDEENSYIEIHRYIRTKLAILDLGITPAQLFKSPHPEGPKKSKKNSMIDLNSSIKSNSRNLSSFLNISNSSNNDDNSLKKKNDKKTKKKDNEKKINELFIPIKNFIEKEKSEKYAIVLNNQTMNLFFIFKNTIIIYNIFNISKKNNNNIYEPQIKYPITLKLNNDLIEIDSFNSLISKNICCELMTGFYCICRNDNKTLQFINYNQKYVFSYLWSCIITAIEPYNYNIMNKSSISNYKWKLFLGDEEGLIYIIDFSFKYTLKNAKNDEIKMTDIKIIKKIKVHKSYIHIISYNERLNIIISASKDGNIAINNAFSLETLNNIEIGNNYLINNIKITFYDLLYVNCYNNSNNNYYIKCYTLNGLKVTKMKTEKKIINFFINDNVNVFYDDKTYEKFSPYDFKEKSSFNNEKKNSIKSNNVFDNEIPMKEEAYYDDDDDDEEDSENSENIENSQNNTTTNLVHCNYCNKIKKLINIYDNNQMSLEKL